MGQRAFAKFLLELSAMLEAGMSPESAFVALRNGWSGGGRGQLADALHDRISGGMSLSDACAQDPGLFSPLFSAMLRAGEARGRLPEALADISILIESRLAMRRKLILALLYPSIVLLVAMAVVTFLVTVVTPRFAELYKDLGADLPAVTSSLITTTDAIRNSVWWVLGAVICVAVGFSLLRRSMLGRVIGDWLMLKIPVVKGINKKSISARFARAYSSLIAGGVEIVKAVRLSGSATGNCIAEQILINASKRVEKGEPLSKALADDRTLSPELLQTLASGEQTGRGDELLSRLAVNLEAEVAHAMTAIMICLPVLATLIVAGMVVWIALAIMVPWFQLPGLIV